MALQHIAPIVVLIFHLYGSSLAGDLYKLPNNKLAEGKDRDLPGSIKIDCGVGVQRHVTTKTYKTLEDALKSFKNTPFTSGAVGAPGGPTGGEKKYKFAEFHGDKYLYALHVNPSGEPAYWLPQGGSIDIPQHPDKHQPHYVFTPDLIGCSWTVTPMHNGKLRCHHVEGTKEHEQFNKLTEAQRGGPVSYGIQYRDYGHMMSDKHMRSNIQASAFMRYDKHWTLYVQCKPCSPETGGFAFDAHQILTGLIMNEHKQKKYPPISRTLEFTVPTK